MWGVQIRDKGCRRNPTPLAIILIMGSTTAYRCLLNLRSREVNPKKSIMNRSHPWQGLLLWVLLLACSHPVGIQNLRIKELADVADLIAVADVGEVKQVGSAPPIKFRSQRLEARAYSTNLVVVRTIKGEPNRNVTVRYSLPTSFVGYRGLRPGTRLIFLRRERDGYGLANPYYPDFPAITARSGDGSPSGAGDPVEAVVGEMLAVVASTSASLEEKSEILAVDYALPGGERTLAAFKEGLANAQEPDLRQRLMGELIRLGDLGELPGVIQLLLTNTATQNQRISFLYLIGNRLNDPRAIPALEPLLKSSDNTLRAAAVEALWHMADTAAVPELVKALQDPNELVRFYAVRGLSDVANEPGWGGPSESEFHRRQQEYLTHWEKWANGLGT
jgi:hypothetical protein